MSTLFGDQFPDASFATPANAAAAAGVVPEPASADMLMLTGLALLRRRR